jgi:hypothetical protein
MFGRPINLFVDGGRTCGRGRFFWFSGRDRMSTFGKFPLGPVSLLWVDCLDEPTPSKTCVPAGFRQGCGAHRFTASACELDRFSFWMLINRRHTIPVTADK